MQTQSSEGFKNITSYLEKNISPFTYEAINKGASHNLTYAIIFCIIGFLLIFIIEYIAKTKNV